MIEALYIGATGMQAQQLNVETIANNLTNANTPNFKKARVNFFDLVTQQVSRLQPSDNAIDQANVLAALQRLGVGVGVGGASQLFDQGDLKKTDSPYDLAINGVGLIEVTMADGTSAYTRGGTLKVSRDGLLTTQNGQVLKPAITVPDNAKTLTIKADGQVLAEIPGQKDLVTLGQLELVAFANYGGLTPLGDNLYRASEASGEAIIGNASENNLGNFAQGFLEASNVKMVDEIVNLMVAQRSYEASVKVVQAADEMMGLANNLRR